MDKTQLLSIEITTECNLANEHARCPNRSVNRYRRLDTQRRLDDPTIVGIVRRMYREFGFRGLVAWHYYCEPLCERERMFGLMGQIGRHVPEARFLLWTNGTLFDDNLEPFKAFERIVITDYGSLNMPLVERLVDQQPGVSVHAWQLDGRLEVIGNVTTTPCGRMFAEFVIDAFGNVHLCCFDWEGRSCLGNVNYVGIDVIVERWTAIRSAISGQAMPSTAPDVCLRCIHKQPGIPALLPPIIAASEPFLAAKEYVKQIRTPRPIVQEQKKLRKVAVVFASYLKVPSRRLRDHFMWNGAIYKGSGASVYVVTEKPKRVPKYAECVVFPLDKLPKVDGKPRFSICATKNAGIQKAIADGADVVLCIDVDHAFTQSSWNHMVNVADNEASVPTYRMLPRFGERNENHLDMGATGVVAMTADNWRKVSWDERYVGYGGDDGQMLRAIKNAGLKVNRDAIIDHIEHPGATHERNEPGHGRAGCYGRDEFNFDNFDENKKIGAR